MSEHDQQMSLLSLELELRKELVANIQTIKNQAVEKEQKLEEKERKLDALLPQIHTIRKVEYRIQINSNTNFYSSRSLFFNLWNCIQLQLRIWNELPEVDI